MENQIVIESGIEINGVKGKRGRKPRNKLANLKVGECDILPNPLSASSTVNYWAKKTGFTFKMKKTPDGIAAERIS